MTSASDFAFLNARYALYDAEKKVVDLQFQARKLQAENAESEELAKKITQATNERYSAQLKVDEEGNKHRAEHYTKKGSIHWRH